MKQVAPIFKREFVGYFRTPVAYVFLVAFLLISVALAFSRFGGFFKAGIASLDAYFGFYPWLFLFIVPVGRDAALVGGEEVRHRRAPLHAARDDARGRDRQVPRRMGVPRRSPSCSASRWR